MIVDTPIFDDQFRKLIKNAISINDRLERCEIFAKYLDTQWDKSSLSTSLFDWGMISAQLREDIDRIKVRIEN
jgi:hypothetical protein